MTFARSAGFDPTIARGLGFDQADLECNQRGTLSPAQISAVRAEHTSMVGQSRVAAIVMGVFYVGVTLVGVVGAAHEGGVEMALKVAAVFVAIAVLVVVANFIHSHRHRQADLRLFVTSGVALCREDSDSYRIDIGGVTFHVAQPIFASLQDGQRYRVYYVEHPFAHWRRPVSAEVEL